MADESDIKLGIVLEGIDKIASSISSLGGPFSKVMGEISSSTKSATDMLDMMTEALTRAKNAKTELDQASNASDSGGGKSTTVAPSSDNASGGGGVPPLVDDNTALTIAGTFWRGVTEALKDVISPEDFAAVQQVIRENFAEPLADIPDKAKKAEDHVNKLGETGLKAFEKLSSSAKHFAEALAEASVGSALEGMEELASTVATVGENFGAIGTTVGAAAIGLAAFTAAIVGADAASLLLAEHASSSVIAMDNLGKSAGVSAAEIYSLESAFNEMGVKASQFEMAIRGINNRLLSGWPEIRREVRDSADTLQEAFLRIADAQDKLNDTKREGTLMDEKIREAERGVNDARRNIDAAQDNKLKAELAYQDALDGRLRAEMRVADAERAVSAASREIDQSQISLRQSLVQQKEAAFGVADAYRAVKEAQLGLAGSATSLALDKLSLQEAVYKRGVSRGLRPADPALEQNIARRREDLQIEAMRQRVASDELAVQKAREELEKRKIEAKNAGDIQAQANLNVAAARDRADAAPEGLKKAQLDYEKALRDQKEAAIAVRDASRALQAAAEGIPASVDKFAEAVASFEKAVQNAAAQPRRVAEDEIGLRRAQNDYQDKRNDDFKLIAATLGATDEERKKDAESGDQKYVNLSDVSVEKMAQAIALMASPDGGKTKANAEQVIFSIADVLNKNKDSADYGTIRAAVSKVLAPRGDLNAFLEAATEGGSAGLKKKMAADKVTAEQLYGEGPIRNARLYEGAQSRLKSAADEQAVGEGNKVVGLATEQYEAFTTFLKTADFSGFTQAISEATRGVTSFAQALNGARGWTDYLGITKPERTGTRGAGSNTGPGSERADMYGEAAPSKIFAGKAENGAGYWDSLMFGLGYKQPTQEDWDKYNKQPLDIQIERDLINALAQIASALSGFGGGAEKKAGGGRVHGRGTTKSDSVPAFLSRDEYVMNADAVSHWGVGMLDAMNSMTVPGFAMGGFVSSPRVGFQSSKMVQTHQYALDIRTDEGSFPAMVSEDTINSLAKSAMGAKLRSSGVKPSWYK